MNQKVIIFILGFLSLIGIILVVVILTKKSPPTTTQIGSKTSYLLSITEYNKLVYAKLDTNGKITDLSTDNLSQYGSVSFNGPHDLMYVSCTNNFNLSNATSTTANQLFIDPVTGTRTDITEGRQNNVIVTCTSK